MRTVTVTVEDIGAGRRLSCRHCPVSLALKRFGWESPFVGEAYLSREGTGRKNRFYPASPIESYAAPRTVQEFIQAFDAGRPVTPFSFTLPG
jgi:hypothetical protein